MSQNRIKVTLVKSPIGAKQNHRASVRGLGLKRMHQSVVVEDTPAVRGMINQVNYLVRWTPATETAPVSPPEGAKSPLGRPGGRLESEVM